MRNGPVQQQEESFYDRLWASDWRELPSSGPLADVRERLVLRELRPFLRAAARLLDVGCGDGTFLVHLLARHPEVDVAGIDFSATGVSSAPEPLKPRLAVGDVERLADHYPPASFDLATCIEVLEHVSRPEAVVEGLARLLRPGGVFVLTVPHGMRHWSDLDEAGGHLRRFETEPLRALLAAAGLEPRRLLVWGGPVGLPYYALTKRLGAKRVASAAKAGPSRLAARMLRTALRIDDLFPNRHGFQLVARAHRP